jgi:hypothetical protein
MTFYNDIEAANRRIQKLESVAEAARNQLARLFKLLAPQCTPDEELIHVCHQIDNYIFGLREELEKCRSELIHLTVEVGQSAGP